MTVLTTRDLNRATLARQLLTERAPMSALAAVEHLVGMQAQAPFPPYTGLWSRLVDFDPAELAGLLLDRSVVRIALMRGTVHLVSAADCLALRAVLQPVLERQTLSGPAAARRLAGLDLDEVVAFAVALMDKEPCPSPALGRALVERFAGYDRMLLLNVVRTRLPLVQVPPRAVWGRAGQTTLTTADTWLGRAPGTDPAPDAAVLRYLAAFGPASVADVQKWSGLTGLREVVERNAGALRTVRDEQGRTLYDLPDAPRPPAELPVPVRFLPDFDNALISYVDIARIADPAHRSALFSVNGIISATVLVDGFVAATWRIVTTRREAVLQVSPLVRLTARDRAQIEAEGARLLTFTAPDADPVVRFA